MTDLILQAWVSSIIEYEKFAWMLGRGDYWRPGQKLKLLFAGYNGTRNTGSDVRVDEILRQVRAIFGSENVDLAVMTQNFSLTKGYFGDARQVHLPDVFPPFLQREVPRHHGVIACEGSMFKSKFANALTTMMIGALGIASAQNKLSVGYGAEAGAMDPALQKMVSRYCRESLIITRNPESQEILGKLGVPTELGTDTAWTFQPHGPEYGKKALRDAGWDGKTPVLTVCPIHPFWWPVKASMLKGVAHLTTGAYKSSHYRSLYFHRSGRQVDRAFENYLSAIASAVTQYRAERPCFTVLIAMEQLDKIACRLLAEKLGGAPIFSSDQYNMYELVSILRCCDRMISSRFHAVVTSMPAGVVSAGITMDERLANLLHDRGHNHLLLRVDDPELAEKLLRVMRRLDQDADKIRESIACAVVRNLRMMARMGMYLEARVAQRYPNFPVRAGALSWENYLPPLDPQLQRLAEAHDHSASQVPNFATAPASLPHTSHA
jgi:polysaccharide pyruvyl transferase WcaK-like protein